jgi:hypothetical protein
MDGFPSLWTNRADVGLKGRFFGGEADGDSRQNARS